VKLKSRKPKHSAIGFLLLAATIAFSGCASFKQSQGIAFDHRDYVEIPVGTVIQKVPFYVNGKDKAPVLLDYTTETEGAFFSGAAQEVLKK
jgi:hypothetical protein